MLTPAWLTWARAREGLREIVGDKHNPAVVALWRLGKVALDVSDDEVPWCAAFVGAALEEAGYRGTRSGLARSYEANKKLFVDCDERLGAIVVLSSSAGPTSGHVGFLEGQDGRHLMVRGGNQGNKVCVAPFPRSRLLRLCWPSSAPSADKYPLAPDGAGGSAVSDR